MFAKVFAQIYDSSIAEDYNCRRMFMDLLVLADSDGVVDMTMEAIARRTNVPMDQVVKYVKELCQPDEKSRSRLHEGKRLIPLDPNRDWGWIIVNYAHYRKVRDEEARREYFRSAMRKSRKKKRDSVKDKGLTDLTKVNRVQPPASTSSSKSKCTQKEAEEFCLSIGLPASDGTAMFLHWEEKGWAKVKNWQLTIRKWQSFGYLPSQKQSKNGAPSKVTYKRNYLPPPREPTQSEIDNARTIAKRETQRFRDSLNRKEENHASQTKSQEQSNAESKTEA